VDVICLDKTGTVTQGRISLARVSDGEQEEAPDELTPVRMRVLAAALRATIGRRGVGHREDPTDDALFEGAAGLAVDASYGCEGWKRRAELSLRVGRTYHAVLGQRQQGGLLCVKGAPEALLLECTTRHRGDRIDPLDDAGRMELVRVASGLAERGLRVLAVAERPIPADVALTPAEVCDLTFRGFVAFSDPVRPTAAEAIVGLRRAGVDTVMITGDHPSTARAIAGELDLAHDKRVMTGAELAATSDDDLDHHIGDVAVFARVTPSQKVRVVRALQRAGRVVAMAGDGTNDAAAIRLADVGIAVGEASTAAARGAADLVLTDGRVETLVDAIVEGRAMWASVRNAVGILMGGNLGEIGFTLAAGLIDGRPPLHARQLLLVNLLTDVAPAMAIALRPPEAQTFEALARENPDVALGAALDQDIATRAIVTTLGAGGAWAFGRLTGTSAKARTIALMALVGTQLGQTMASGGYSRPVVLTSLLSMGFLSTVVQTPGVSHFFGCRPLGPIGWTAAIGASAAATMLSGKVASFVSGGTSPGAAAAEPAFDYPTAGELAAAV
jgi:cation-transporting ATPase I